ncbi:hypothetical protein G7072_13110 [Nocardioides sp. HDW12B]|uniref:Abi-alpha family protein n=1 Tax=Nocardioides sp. HDW12B TaxID=2714939 RepID=UPI00140B89A4|nr:hypothetical protein [Nocardioides sp. HDW12B]QIK67155.1 hypothetical protein G7072_13110 [Nocardioides sp. HDW12B]
MALLPRFDVFSRRAGRGGAPADGQAAGAVDGTAAAHPAVPRQGAGQQLRRLLAEAESQDAAAGRDAWLARAVEHLVPDEARVLAVLAAEPDGTPGRALVHIHCMTPTGLNGESLLENVVGIGDAAPLALPQLVPYYVGRLLALDLVEIGPADPRLENDYPALLADPTVLEALTAARAQGLTPRVMRHSLRLSPLGRELWDLQDA